MNQVFSEEDFKKYFYKNILPVLKKMKKSLMIFDKKKQLGAYFLICFILIFLFFIIGIFLNKNPFDEVFGITYFALMGILFFVSLLKPDLFKTKVYDYKKYIYSLIFSYFGDFKYSSTIKKIDKNFLEFNKNFGGNFLVDDYISGTYKNKPVRIMELYNDLYVDNVKRYGLYLLITFPQKRKNNANVIIKNCKSLNIKDSFSLQKVTLEDIEVQRTYEVYSDDQIEARVVLTPKFMETLKKYNSKKYQGVYIPSFFFRNGQVHILFENWSDHFEIDSSNCNYEYRLYEQCLKIVRDFRTILSYIDDLDLCD